MAILKMASILRLLLALSLVMMPFAMAADPGHAHAAALAAAADDCDTHQVSGPVSAPASADCAVNCTALAWVDPPTREMISSPRLPRLAAQGAKFIGVVPETATPPPKLA